MYTKYMYMYIVSYTGVQKKRTHLPGHPFLVEDPRRDRITRRAAFELRDGMYGKHIFHLLFNYYSFSLLFN